MANNVSEYDIKRLIQSECRKGISVNKEDTWVRTNKYVEKQIMNLSLLRKEHLKRV